MSLTRIGNNCSETSTKFLGILIDENLSWKQHISYLNSKISRTLFTINQVKHFLPYDSLTKLYSTLVESHLSYGIMTWGNASECAKYKILLLQKRAIRAINKANYNSHTSFQRISRSHLKYSMMASQLLKYAPVVTCSNNHCKDYRKS